jgi:hypothetical protein
MAFYIKVNDGGSDGDYYVIDHSSHQSSYEDVEHTRFQSTHWGSKDDACVYQYDYMAQSDIDEYVVIAYPEDSDPDKYMFGRKNPSVVEE